MKIKTPFLLLLTTPLLLGCGIKGSSGNEPGGVTPNEDETNDTQEQVVSHSIQDANILHAWNWTMNDIKANLGAIKNAGYKAIQISPMQPKKDKTGWNNQSTSSQWWKLYQPLAFKVAENGENFLGTKTELKSLCAEAKKQGISIIVDVVANHLAGDKNGNYDGQVYTKYPLHNYNGGTNDTDGESVVKGRIGLPDLDTSSSQVQNAVLGLLKEYLDCGISGFRFDAAKHIETPDDKESYASNFWTTVLDGATSYADEHNIAAPYYYGEVLNTPGAGRKWESYTKLMSVCDNKQGTSTVNAVKSRAANSLPLDYNTGIDPDHLVLWAESHDTYANTSGYELTTSFSKDIINRAYMIQASRKDAATLYLARPDSMSSTICSVSDESGWKDKEIAAINNFHTHYVAQSEHINIQDNKYFVNVRGSGAFAGAAIINLGSASTASINVEGLQNGDYTDLVSGNTLSVNNGKVDATFTNGACIIVPQGSVAPAEEYTKPINVILNNTDPSKFYYAWVFEGSASDKWIQLSTANEGFGFDLGGYSKFVIAEFNTNNPNWNNINWQTNDITFATAQVDGKVILDCNTVQRK